MVGIGPIPMPIVLMLVALLVAAAVGHWAASPRGDDPRIPVAGTFFDMLLVGLLAGRIAFVLAWWPLYAADPWSILRLGDGGYSIWAAVPAGLGFGVWRLRRRPQLRRPLLWGTLAGLGSWAALAGSLALMQASVLDLPEVELRRIEGGSLQLSSMKGRPIVVNLWATWCPPCRREMPVLAEGQARHPGIGFVFVNQGEGDRTVDGFLRDSALQLRNVVMDPFSSISQEAGVRGLPATLFFDAGGKLVDVHMGELTRAGLARKLQRFNAVPGGADPPLADEARR